MGFSLLVRPGRVERAAARDLGVHHALDDPLLHAKEHRLNVHRNEQGEVWIAVGQQRRRTRAVHPPDTADHRRRISVTLQHTCDLCGNPSDPSAFVCARCSDETAGYLRTSWTWPRRSRPPWPGSPGTPPGPASSHPSPSRTTGPDPTHVNRRQPVGAFGWPASKDRPKKGALRASSLPVDLNASARAAGAFNAVTTWARLVEQERGVQRAGRPGPRPSRVVAAQFLIGQLDWIRHQPFADEANEQLRAAGAVIKRIVDAPPEREIVGRCDCETYLYAYKNSETVTCPGCSARWDVAASRQKLWDALPEYLMTASEAALLLMLHGIGKYDRRRWAKTITMWAQRGLIVGHGEMDGRPVYRFADVLERATRDQKRSAA
jgi:hypothetical protein